MKQEDETHAISPNGSPTRSSHLGQEYLPLSDALLEDPYPFFERARREEPIFYSDLLHTWIVTRYDDAIAILKQPALFSSKDTMQPPAAYSPSVRAILDTFPDTFPLGTRTQPVDSDGELHKCYRGALSSSFTPASIALLEPFIQNTVDQLISQFVSLGTIDIIAALAYSVPILTIFRLLGVPEEQMEQCRRWSDDFLMLISSQLPEEQQIRCAYSQVAFCKYLVTLIEERRKSPKSDLISNLVNGDGKDFDMSVLVSTLEGLVIAGHVTTANLISNGLKLLLDPPSYWQRLCEDPTSIPWVIEEILRYESPVQTFFRTTTQEVTIGGISLPKDTRLLLAFGSANRDEAQFLEADRFDPMRFSPPNPVTHLALGYGIHVCLGAPLARLEARIVFKSLAERLHGLRLVPGQKLLYIPTTILRGYQQLYVQWDV